MDLYQALSKAPFIIAGPCVIESESVVMKVAEKLKAITTRQNITFVFKSSFDKANRTALNSYRGPGLEEGLRILQKVKDDLDVPIVTDIHESHQTQALSEVVDIIQIPAFLCRQTDLLVAASHTKKIVNIKKAQFLSGKDMYYPVQKVVESGNSQVILTERGNIYGNNDLVVDFRNVIDMQSIGFPIVMDITHSCQKPGGAGGKSGGNELYAAHFANAAAALGVRGFFLETHPDPSKALSDGPNMIPLDKVETLIENILRVSNIVYRKDILKREK